MENIEFKHISVLKQEAIDGLNINPDGIYVDCTLGGGGHSLEIVKKLKNGRLVCFDKDEDAISFAKKKLEQYSDKITFVHDNFLNIDEVLLSLGLTEVDGVLADLGVSSYQIDTADRGFSFRFDSRLDMRMDTSQTLDAEYVINNYSEAELSKILYTYGEEKNARQIARKIVKQREKAPIQTTFQLRDIIISSYPPKFQHKPSLPNKAFQAIRIEVNSELKDLELAVEKMLRILKKNGRLCVITFHPLEDRIVKQAFKLHSTDCICPPRLLKCVCGHKADIRLITRHPIVPSVEELKANSRSASAKLRIVEKL